MSRRSEACFAQLHYGGRALSDGIRSFRYSDLLSTKPPAEDLWEKRSRILIFQEYQCSFHLTTLLCRVQFRPMSCCVMYSKGDLRLTFISFQFGFFAALTENSYKRDRDSIHKKDFLCLKKFTPLLLDNDDDVRITWKASTGEVDERTFTSPLHVSV